MTKTITHITVFLLLAWLTPLLPCQGQPILINEFMASNASTIADEDGDFPDWIELYNSGTDTLNLHLWGLSDNINNPFKWSFPDISLPPGSYLLVWASGKDRTTPQLHTNFSISASGEPLLLTNPSGFAVSQTQPVELPSDVSYGLNAQGEWHYYDNPTPGEPNGEDGFPLLLAPPQISRPAGFYTEAFFLKATHPDPEAVVRFTLDGTVPTENSEIFPDSLLIYNRKNDPNDLSAIPTTPSTVPEWYRWFPPMDTVFKGTLLRLKAFRPDALSPSAHTATFWVDPDIHSRYDLPMISIAMDPDDLLGPNGIYTRFNMTGPQWERDIHLEFFEADGTPGFATGAGIRVHGGNSRRYALKSFRLYFRSRYGNSAIEYPVFPNQQMNRHERLILRNAGSDWAYTYYRDPFVQQILRDHSPVETQAYRPAVVFVNGEYWGVMNIRERYDDNYIRNHYGYENIDMLDRTGVVVYGSNQHYTQLIQFLHNNTLEDSLNYAWVQGQMEVDDFRDYHILQVFSMNTDQPGKNVRFWRPQTQEGKWRWMWWDMDDSFIFGTHNSYDRNGLVFCTGLNSINATSVNPASPPPSWAPNGPTQTFPLRALLGSPWFRQSFINRFADLLNTAFQPQNLWALIDEFDLGINDHLYEHYRRWHRPTPELYNLHLFRLRNFAQHRHAYMTEHLVDFFELPGTWDLELDVAQGQGHFQLNTLLLDPEQDESIQFPWHGTYFSSVPVQIRAVPAHGYQFSHWSGYSQSNDPELTLDPHQHIQLKAHFVEAAIPTLISFWQFTSDLPNDTPLQTIDPFYSVAASHQLLFHSALNGYPFFQGHPLWRKASMERRNRPTSLNYPAQWQDTLPYNPEQIRGIQIKQPFAGDAGENIIELQISSLGYKDLSLAMAVMDEGATDSIRIEYNLEEQPHWTYDGLIQPIVATHDSYSLVMVDFSGIPASNNNPFFGVRLRFTCDDPFEDSGDRITINNVSLHGFSLTDPPVYITTPSLPVIRVYPNPVTRGRLHVSEPADIRLFDLRGMQILQQDNASSIDLTFVPPGVYLLSTSFGQTIKVVVLR